MREGNACRGLFIGTLIAIPIYGGVSWLVQTAWNALTRQHVTYWQMLAVMLALGAVTGGIIAVVGLRKVKQP